MQIIVLLPLSSIFILSFLRSGAGERYSSRESRRVLLGFVFIGPMRRHYPLGSGTGSLRGPDDEDVLAFPERKRKFRRQCCDFYLPGRFDVRL